MKAVIRRFMAFVQRSASAADQSSNGVLLFVALSILLLVMLFPSAWHSNEENYFQLAYRTVAPDRFSRFHAVFDASRARLVPEYIIGYLVHLLGYQRAHAIARIAMAFFYAGGLAWFFRALRLSVLDALLTVVLFKLTGEQLLGEEWLFQDVEAKTLAYALVFVAFGFAITRRWRAATLIGAGATYMHFLVGGFWSLVIVLLRWLKQRDVRASLSSLAVYGLLTLPITYTLAQEQLAPHELASGGLSAGQIYAQIRAPHHMAPFASPHMLWSWSPGIVAALLLTLVVTVLVDEGESTIVLLAGLIGLLELCLALLISFLDSKTLIFAKFYLFRPSSLTLFFVITALTGIMKGQLAPRGRHIRSLVICALVGSFAWRQLEEQVEVWRRPPAIPQREELVAEVEAHTKADDIVLLEPYDEMNPEYASLHRDIPRPTLVSWKFVPTTPSEILRWYSLIQMRQDLFAHGCVSQLALPIRWLVTLRRTSIEHIRNCGPVVWQKGDVALIQIRGETR